MKNSREPCARGNDEPVDAERRNFILSPLTIKFFIMAKSLEIQVELNKIKEYLFFKTQGLTWPIRSFLCTC